MTPRDVVIRLASPRIISETLDGETVVINLDTGVYFSLTQTGSIVWEAIAADGASKAELTALLASRRKGDPGEIADAVALFVDRLVEDGLACTGEETRPAPEEPAASEDAPPFEPPRLDRFTDIQDLLLLDPIHEVDEAGWPAAKAGDDPSP